MKIKIKLGLTTAESSYPDNIIDKFSIETDDRNEFKDKFKKHINDNDSFLQWICDEDDGSIYIELNPEYTWRKYEVIELIKEHKKDFDLDKLIE